MNKKKILLITVIAVFLVLDAIVVRHFMGDLWYRRGRAVLAETEKRAGAPGEGTLAGYERAGEYFSRALSWHGGKAEHHYWRARLCQILTHRYARREGQWDEKTGVFVDGEASQRYGRLAVGAFYRAIEENPACQYYHLELAWLLRSKLPTVAMTADEMLDADGTYSRDILSVSNTWREFERAIVLAPNRTLHRLSFGDFIVTQLAAAERKAGKAVRKKEAFGRMFSEAVNQYRTALVLSPSRVQEVLRSLTTVTTDYDAVRPVLPASNRGLKELVLYLADRGDKGQISAAFRRDMKAFVSGFDGSQEPASILFPYYDTLAELYVKEKKYSRAGTALEAYLVYDPDNDTAHVRIADLFIREKQFEKAGFHLMRALSIDGSQPAYRRKMVSVILSGYDPAAAEPMLAGLSESFPGDASVFEGLGTNYLRMGKEQEAEEAYRTMLTVTEYRARGNYLLGKLYKEKGDRERAAAYLKKAALLDTRYRNEFNRLYPLDVLLREYVQSTHDYDTLKHLIPRTPEALTALALLLYSEGAWNRNRRAFMADMKKMEERLTRLRSEGKPLNDFPVWLLAHAAALSEIHVREGQPCKAITVLRRLTSLDTDNLRGWFLLARLSAEQGRACGYGRRLTEGAFEKALAGDTGNVAYLKAFARYLAKAADLVKAEQVARRAVDSAPRDPESHEVLAGVYDLSGRRNEAIAEMSEAVTLSKGNKYYRERLSDLLKK